MACEICGGTGWMQTRLNHAMGSTTAVTRCVCWARAKAERDKQTPDGFEKPYYQLPMMNYDIASLPKPDRDVAQLIESRRGKMNAISIEEICKSLWPSAWFGGGSADAVELHRKRNELARTVKASVERIRREARMPIAASKTSPGGYYIPVTAEECDECHDRLFREGIKLIELSQLFRADKDLVAELRGQLKF